MSRTQPKRKSPEAGVEVDFAFLADFADRSSDGKLYVAGGAIDRVFAQQVPTRLASLALVIRFVIHPSEFYKTHEYSIQLRDPTGALVEPRVKGTFSTGPTENEPDLLPTALFILHLMALEVKQFGAYTFEIVVDGHLRKRLPLVVRARPGTAKDEDTEESTITESVTQESAE